MAAERFDHWPEKQTTHTLTAASLNHGDVVLVRAGAVVPADGLILEGASHVEEAVLTGESWPQRRAVGDKVFAGSVNRENALIVGVSEVGEATRLATILRLGDRAAHAVFYKAVVAARDTAQPVRRRRRRIDARLVYARKYLPEERFIDKAAPFFRYRQHVLECIHGVGRFCEP